LSFYFDFNSLEVNALVQLVLRLGFLIMKYVGDGLRSLKL